MRVWIKQIICQWVPGLRPAKGGAARLAMLLWVIWSVAGSALAESVGETEVCDLRESERRLLELIVNSAAQHREALECQASLVEFARARAEDMASRNYFSHVNPDRFGPNSLLRDAGYALPDSYGGGGSNSVEAIAAGYSNPEVVFRKLLNSSTHRAHLLGEGEFFRVQDQIGVAHAYNPDSDYEDYWVIIIARTQRPDEPRLICTPEPAICFEI